MRAVLCLFALSVPMLAADLSGSWVASRQRPGGGPAMETQFNFKQDGSTLGGSVVSNLGEQKIVAGKVEGDTFEFEVESEMFGQARRMKYTGTIDGEELKIRMQMPQGMGPGGPGGPPPGAAGAPRPGGPGAGPGAGGMRGFGEMVAKRGVSETLKREAEALAKRPKPALPALRKLEPNGLARTPPMGWNSWNKFRLNISDKLIRETADVMVSSGMRDAGYIYLNIDDGWQGTRDEKGVLHPNERFPDMKALGDYVHSKGLKLGIYTSPGPQTCGRQEGSYGYEEQDAKMFAAWGIDYVKYDWCSARRTYSNDQMRQVYQMFAEKLRATGRPIVYGICQYGMVEGAKWAADAGGNLWRTTGDIRETWDSIVRIGFGQNGLEVHAGPGHWNDPDMLEVGNGDLTLDENRAHFSLWAMLAAPLLTGNDLTTMKPEIKQILLNRDVIAVNQDKLGRQGKRVAKDGEIEIWAKELSGGEWAVAMFNLGEEAAEARASWAGLGLKGSWKVRDLWTGKNLGARADGFSATISSHGVSLIRLRK